MYYVYIYIVLQLNRRRSNLADSLEVFFLLYDSMVWCFKGHLGGDYTRRFRWDLAVVCSRPWNDPMLVSSYIHTFLAFVITYDYVISWKTDICLPCRKINRLALFAGKVETTDDLGTEGLHYPILEELNSQPIPLVWLTFRNLRTNWCMVQYSYTIALSAMKMAQQMTLFTLLPIPEIDQSFTIHPSLL